MRAIIQRGYLCAKKYYNLEYYLESYIIIRERFGLLSSHHQRIIVLQLSFVFSFGDFYLDYYGPLSPTNRQRITVQDVFNFMPGQILICPVM